MKTFTDIVLFSGGLDSAVTLAISIQSGNRPALFFGDLQFRSTHKERVAVKKLADYYSVPIFEAKVTLPDFQHSMRSQDEYIYFGNTTKKRLGKGDTFIIPYRNFLLISAALMCGGFLEAKRLWMGFDYLPTKGCSRDKSPDFVNHFQQAIASGGESSQQMQLVTPIQGFDKTDTITQGLSLNVPFHLTWSCYNNFRYSCGICNACVHRLQSFKALNQKDPIRYMTQKELQKICGNTVIKIYKSIWG